MDALDSAAGPTPADGNPMATTHPKKPPNEGAPAHSKRKRSMLSPMRASARLVFAVAAGLIAIMLTPRDLAVSLRAMVVWDAVAVALLAQSWAILLTSDAEATKQRAGEADPGKRAVFVIAVASSLFSLFASTLVYRLARTHAERDFWLALALLSVALSWFLTHTAYALRYAHLYYRGAKDGGLVFPGDEQPDDLDFAYYAFTLGMCFQVSDVQVTSREIRRVSLVHALVAFVFNTTILALALNVMSQLLDS